MMAHLAVRQGADNSYLIPHKRFVTAWNPALLSRRPALSRPPFFQTFAHSALPPVRLLFIFLKVVKADLNTSFPLPLLCRRLSLCFASPSDGGGGGPSPKACAASCPLLARRPPNVFLLDAASVFCFSRAAASSNEFVLELDGNLGCFILGPQSSSPWRKTRAYCSAKIRRLSRASSFVQ